MIDRIRGVGGPQDFKKLEKQKGDRALPSAPAGKSDSVQVSDNAKLLRTLKTMPEVRSERVTAIKQQVKDGSYITNQKLDAAIDKLISAKSGDAGAVGTSSYTVKTLFEFSFQSYREVSFASGATLINRDAFEFSFSAEYEVSTTKATEVKNPADLKAAMGDKWSPEATASRIFEFATAFYGKYLENHKTGDSTEVRQDFADMMLAAVDKGFEMAAAITGKMPEAVEEIVSETHANIRSSFEAFVTGELKNWQANNLKLADPFVQKYDKNFDGVLTYGDMRSSRTAAKKPPVAKPAPKAKAEPSPEIKDNDSSAKNGSSIDLIQ